jgi:hypothetical protein
VFNALTARRSLSLSFFGINVSPARQAVAQPPMAHPLTIGETTFDVERIVPALPTRDAETGNPKLDVHLVRSDGRDGHVVVCGDRAVEVVTDIRRRHLFVGPNGCQDQSSYT